MPAFPEGPPVNYLTPSSETASDVLDTERPPFPTLSPKEGLVYTTIANSQEPIGRDALMKAILEYNPQFPPNTLHSTISNINEKLDKFDLPRITNQQPRHRHPAEYALQDKHPDNPTHISSLSPAGILLLQLLEKHSTLPAQNIDEAFREAEISYDHLSTMNGLNKRLRSRGKEITLKYDEQGRATLHLQPLPANNKKKQEPLTKRAKQPIDLTKVAVSAKDQQERKTYIQDIIDTIMATQTQFSAEQIAESPFYVDMATGALIVLNQITTDGLAKFTDRTGRITSTLSAEKFADRFVQVAIDESSPPE